MNIINFRQHIVDPDWDIDEDLEMYRNDAEHDWDNDFQDYQFHALDRWGDVRPNIKEYNKTEK